MHLTAAAGDLSKDASKGFDVFLFSNLLILFLNNFYLLKLALKFNFDNLISNVKKVKFIK